MGDALRVGVIGLGSVFEPYAELLRRLQMEGRVRVVKTCDVNPAPVGRIPALPA